MVLYLILVKLKLFNSLRNLQMSRNYMGMANHLYKFMPNLAETTKCLRDLLSDKNHFTWNKAQQTAFDKINQSLISSPVLDTYDPSKMTIIAADVSWFGGSFASDAVQWLMPASHIRVTSFNTCRKALRSN